MKTIFVTKERAEQVLPQQIKESSELSNNAKKVLATLIHFHFVLDKAIENKCVYLTNTDLRRAVGIQHNAMLTAITELCEYNLIIRKVGVSREKGQKATASKYIIQWKNLLKPLKRKSYFELYNDYLNNAETLTGTAETETEIEIEEEKEIEKELETEIEIDYSKK